MTIENKMDHNCICNCGYRCGGPGKCDLWKKDGIDGMLECIEKHFVRDCGHDFSGTFINYSGGGSVTCRHCGMTANDHDCMVGP